MMATYYSTISSSPTDNLQTPTSSSCQLETNLPNNPHLNPISMCSYSDILSGATAAATSLSPHHHHSDEYSASQFGVTRNNEMMFIPPMSDEAPDLHPHVDASLATAGEDHHAGFHIQGGLSLSLGTQMGGGGEAPSFHHYQYSVSEPEEELLLPGSLGKWNNHNHNNNHHGGGGGGENVIKMEGGGGVSMNNPNPTDHFLQGNENNNVVEVYDTLGYANVSLVNSRYLKATHELLDEVVNVKYALAAKGEENKCSDENKEGNDGVVASGESGDGNSSSATELSPSERQDLQSKKSKLVTMIDEVDRRYKQYYHQMQALVSSLDMVAGNGAAKSYTALALQTISRRFRCLRDAIGSQIDVIRKKLGEPDASPQGGSCIPRLRYVEQQLRQQRALQQLGVMRHAWRPQRGLPENSVSVLRAWLFEHFLHPYPNDSEKLMLAKQTGLSRNQVANWFINARVRLWKPMVEEMYKEECGGSGDSDANSKSSNEEANRNHGGGGAALDHNQHLRPHDHQLVLEEHDFQDTSSPSLAADHHHHFLHHHGSSSIISFQQEPSQPRPRSTMEDHDHHGLQHYVVAEQSTLPLSLSAGDGSLMSAAVQYGGVSEVNAGLIPGMVGATGHHHHVSLDLGLQHNEMEGGGGGGDEMVDYHNCLDGKAPEQHHRFGNTVHLLHDFVVSKNPCF